MSDKTLPSGCTKANIDFLRNLKEIDGIFARNNYLLFFLITELKVSYCRRLLISGCKQRNYIRYGLIPELKRKQVTKKYIPIIEKSIQKYYERTEYVLKMIKENLRLTEYFPFFESRNWEDFEIEEIVFDGGSQLEYIKNLFSEWKETHEEEINKYLLSVEKGKRNYEVFVANKTDDAKAFKKTKREIEKNLRATEKETEKQIKAMRKEENRIERSFNYLYG